MVLPEGSVTTAQGVDGKRFPLVCLLRRDDDPLPEHRLTAAGMEEMRPRDASARACACSSTSLKTMPSPLRVRPAITRPLFFRHGMPKMTLRLTSSCQVVSASQMSS